MWTAVGFTGLMIQNCWIRYRGGFRYTDCCWVYWSVLATGLMMQNCWIRYWGGFGYTGCWLCRSLLYRCDDDADSCFLGGT